MANLVEAFRAQLVADGVGRHPRVAGSLPPIYVDKRPLPAPGEATNLTERHPDAVIGLYLDGGIAEQPMNSDRRMDVVQARIRVKDGPTAYRLGALIRASVVDRINWKLGGDVDGIRVVQSRTFTMLQPIENAVESGVVTWIFSALFETYAAVDGWRSEPAA